jgi:hypothetical protein
MLFRNVQRAAETAPIGRAPKGFPDPEHARVTIGPRVKIGKVCIPSLFYDRSTGENFAPVQWSRWPTCWTERDRN